MSKKAVQTTIGIESRINEKKGITYIKREKIWTLWLTAETKLKDIEDFYDVAEGIFKDCISAHKKFLTYEVEVYRLTEYDDGSKGFDRWVSAPCSGQDGEGLYFCADTKYTDGTRDIYLQKKSVRKDLASALY